MALIPLDMILEGGVVSYIMDKLKIRSRLILPQLNDAANPSLAFGDGNSGFYESADNSLKVSIAGINVWQMNAVYLGGGVTLRPCIRNVDCSDTIPNINCDILDTDTGIGNVAADQLSLIAGGVEGHRISEAAGAITHDLTGVINANGGQIKFPATQAPSADVNTLDDYEEGTWTPGISFGGGVTGITYTYQSALYTKIGRQVSISGFITLSSKGTDTGAALITGLPFTVKNDIGAYAPCGLRFNGISFADRPQAYPNPNTTTIILEEILNNGTMTTLNDTNFANNSAIMFSVTYFV